MPRRLDPAPGGEPPYDVDSGRPRLSAAARGPWTPTVARILVSACPARSASSCSTRACSTAARGWHHGALQLPQAVRWHGPRSATSSRTWRELETLLDKGFVGLQVPATLAGHASRRGAAGADAARLRTGGPAGARASRSRAGPRRSRTLPAWWAPVVDYPPSCRPPGGRGRRPGAALLPALRICFAAGAGLAPCTTSGRGTRRSTGAAGDPAHVRRHVVATGRAASTPRPGARHRRDRARHDRPYAGPIDTRPGRRRDVTRSASSTRSDCSKEIGHDASISPRLGCSLPTAHLPGRDLDRARAARAGRARSRRSRKRGGSTWPSATTSGTTSQLHRDTHVDVWLLCWTPRNDTGWHDHDISSGAVAVVDGRLIEHGPRGRGARAWRIEVAAGQAFSFGPDHIHRLTGVDAGSVSRPRLLAAAVADGPVRGQQYRRCCGALRSPTPTSCARSTTSPEAIHRSNGRITACGAGACCRSSVQRLTSAR